MNMKVNISKEDNCSCKGSSLDKLIQPSILIILSNSNEIHGYGIIQKLEEMDSVGVDKAGVYRTLKIMEEKGHIDSAWLDEENKPSKKVFSINKSGYYCLYNWISTLKKYRSKLDGIIEVGSTALVNLKSSSGDVTLWDEDGGEIK